MIFNMVYCPYHSMNKYNIFEIQCGVQHIFSNAMIYSNKCKFVSVTLYKIQTRSDIDGAD